MTQSKPAKEHWTDLATRSGSEGREDCQGGWQLLASNLIPPNMTILDVGAGLGRSAGRLGHSRTTTQDPALGLLDVQLTTPIENIPDQSYDAVTCFDVIEHVMEDITFLDHLKRIARRYVFITTPNFNVSRAANGCHCREYTPFEFMQLMKGIGRTLWCGNGPGTDYTKSPEHAFVKHTYPHQAALLDVTRGNLGRWRPWYHHMPADHQPTSYGQTMSYYLGARFLEECPLVEDWGCGMGYFRQHLESKQVINIDGTKNPHVDKVVDLAHYRSSPPGIFMRGVIEHDRRWQNILTNAILSFTERMVLVLFTPLMPETQELAFNEELGVPDIGFSLNDLLVYVTTPEIASWRCQTIRSGTTYGAEILFYLKK